MRFDHYLFLFNSLTNIISISSFLVNFKWPFHRDYLLSHGLVDVSKESINYVFSKKGTGNVGIIVIGGAAEAMESYPKAATVVLKNRKGFVKVAIRNG